MEDNLPGPSPIRLPQIKVVVGLGNPGRDYQSTRHNLGYMVVELLAGNRKLVAAKGEFYLSRCEIPSGEIALLKPTTYMNRSGLAVAQYAEDNGLTPPEILVVTDDFYLPLGRLRLRASGSDGGHKGLASIIYHLGSEDFPRVRLGIGPVPEGIAAEDFVLMRFSDDEAPIAADMVRRAADAVIVWSEHGFEIAAGRFNRPAE